MRVSIRPYTARGNRPPPSDNDLIAECLNARQQKQIEVLTAIAQKVSDQVHEASFPGAAVRTGYAAAVAQGTFAILVNAKARNRSGITSV